MAKRRIRLPRLSRGWRIIRNLAVALVCLYALWARAGYPLPTPELEFRRLERENLLGRSEIQGIFQASSRDRTIFGTQGDQVLIGYHSGRTLESWPKEKSGPTLFLASKYNSSFTEELLIAAADLPEGTASARLDMTIDCWFASPEDGTTRISALEGGCPRDDSLDWNHWERDYQAEGELLKEGGVLFRVPRGDGKAVSIEQDLFWILNRENTFLYQTSAARGVNCHMEAVFYGEDGGELGRAVLSTPEDGDSAAH